MTTETDGSSPTNGNYDPLYLEAINTFRAKHVRTPELGVREPSAMSLATVDANGQPSIRTVLLRGIDERGFVFFTNSQSRKGTQMAGPSRCMWKVASRRFRTLNRTCTGKPARG